MKIQDFLDSSAIDNVKMALERAKSHSESGALISLTEERAMERAKLVDAGEISGRLKGVPKQVAR